MRRRALLAFSFGCLPSLAACIAADDPTGDGAEPDPGRPGSPCAGDEDWGIDGVVDVRWRYFEDAGGRDLRDEGHYDGDGIPDNMWQYEWTEAGQLAAKRWLLHGDVWFSQETSYDSEGRRSEERIDGDGAGAEPPDTTTYRYDGDRLIEEVSDQRTDGVVDERRTFEYDSAGLLSLARVDLGGNGAIDEHEIHSYDANAWLSDIEYDHPVGGVVEDVEQFARDPAGRLVGQIRDDSQDGSIEYRMSSQYDLEGRLIERMVDADGGGPWQAQITLREYDMQGRLASVSTTGFHQSELTLHYDCP